MKDKTSVTLSREILAGIDRLTGAHGSRSAFIEGVLRCHLQEQLRNQAHAHDLKLINDAAVQLNAEALDVLGYQSLEE